MRKVDNEDHLIFFEVVTLQALSDLVNYGVTQAEYVEDLVTRGYAEIELRHMQPIPWLLSVAIVTQKGKDRLTLLEKEDLEKPESERLKQEDPFETIYKPDFYLGEQYFTPERIEVEIAKGHKAIIARCSAGNMSMMGGDHIVDNRRFPEYFLALSHDHFDRLLGKT